VQQTRWLVLGIAVVPALDLLLLWNRGVDPARLPFALLCSTLIAVPMLAVVFLLDWYELEPLRYLALAGASGALFASLLPLLADRIVTLTPLTAAPLEEVSKAIVIFALYRSFTGEFDSPVDALVYSFLVAAGFTFFENVAKLGDPHIAALPFEKVMAGRVLASAGHMTFTGFTGLGLALGMERHWRFGPPLGLAIAAGAHTIWNLAASGQGDYFIGLVPMAIVLMYATSAYSKHETEVIRDYGAYHPPIQPFVEGEQEDFLDAARRFENSDRSRHETLEHRLPNPLPAISGGGTTRVPTTADHSRKGVA
jgi:RsiW-degrading membrane proteinase PrsW (M82 family)